MTFEPPLDVSEVRPSFAGSYEIESPLQAGGQGAVFKATTSGAAPIAVALKIYDADKIEERLDREIEALKALRSATLVQLHAAGKCTVRGVECRFLATTLIDGRPLDQVLALDGALALDLVARVGHDVALAIETIWGARIVHRDLKPNNIMLTPARRAIVIDLGIARHIDQSKVTATGKTLGTIGYLSVEQARGSPLSCKSDVFALGIVIQECILGRHPTNRQQAPLMNGGVKTTGLRANLPRFLVQLVDSMVAKSPVLRPMPVAVARTLKPLAGLEAE